jgi:transposase
LARRGYFDDKPYEVLDWPAYSPDLSPIENIWAIMKDKIFDRADEIGNKEDLRSLIENIFFHDETLIQACKNCYLSMPERIQKVIARNGGSCGY